VVGCDGGCILAGSYNPATGSFSVSNAAGAGTNTYRGRLRFDGTTISVSGQFIYDQANPPKNCQNDISGQTVP
jgi:hypothetical protein